MQVKIISINIFSPNFRVEGMTQPNSPSMADLVSSEQLTSQIFNVQLVVVNLPVVLIPERSRYNLKKYRKKIVVAHTIVNMVRFRDPIQGLMHQSSPPEGQSSSELKDFTTICDPKLDQQ